MTLRAQAHPQARRRVRRLLVAALALPVVAWVYAESAAARLRPVGSAALVCALLVGSLAGEVLVGGSTAAAGPTILGALPVTAFQAVVLPTDRVGSGTVEPSSRPRALDAGADRRPLAGRAALPPAEVVRFRPRDGQTAIPREAQVSVRFTTAMDRASTKRAFTVTVNGSPVEGRYRWAEGDTVLVFVPAMPFPYGAKVALSVNGNARSSGGLAIIAGRSVAFAVVRKPPASPASPPAVRPTTPPRASSAWRWPLLGPITQYFGQSLTKYGYHQGIDIDGETGDRVRAARSGIVTVAGYWDSCGGIQVHLDHGGGFESWYRHLSRLDVRVGERVTAGTVIGRVGATGCAFGSHLHFAIRLHGVFVDPLRYLPAR